jgi:hypothetical protein
MHSAQSQLKTFLQRLPYMNDSAVCVRVKLELKCRFKTLIVSVSSKLEKQE